MTENRNIYLLSEQVSHHEKWGIADGLGKFELSSLGDVEAFDILFALIESGVAMLVSGAGNENLITSEVTGSSVMSAMRDSPAVVRNTNGRMKNPSNSVVDGLWNDGESEMILADGIRKGRDNHTFDSEKAWWPPAKGEKSPRYSV